MEQDFSVYNGAGTMLRKAQLRLLEIMIEFDRICKKHDIPYFISGGTCLGAVRHGGFIPWDDDVDIDVMYKDYKRLMKILEKELSPKYFLQTPETDKGFYQVFARIVDKRSMVVYPSTARVRDKVEQKGLFLDIFPLEKVFSYKAKKRLDFWYINIFRVKQGIIGNKLWRMAAYAVWPFLTGAINVAKFISKFSDDERISHSFGTGIIPKLRYSNMFPTKPILFEGRYFSGPAKPDDYLRELYGNYMKLPAEDKRKYHAEKIIIEE